MSGVLVVALSTSPRPRKDAAPRPDNLPSISLVGSRVVTYSHEDKHLPLTTDTYPTVDTSSIPLPPKQRAFDDGHLPCSICCRRACKGLGFDFSILQNKIVVLTHREGREDVALPEAIRINN